MLGMREKSERQSKSKEVVTERESQRELRELRLQSWESLREIRGLQIFFLLRYKIL